VIYRLLGKLMYDSPDIKNRVANRIYFENAPELKSIPVDQRGPCIIIRNFSGSAETHLQNECDMAMPMVQVDAYDVSTSKAHSLYQLVRTRLSGYGPETVAVLNDEGEEEDVFVSSIVLRRSGMFVEEPRDASDKWTYRYTADFEVFHSQPVPTHA
jgi:hypothetical protein